MNNLREEFEKLPEIVERLKRYEHLFDFKLNQYLCEDLHIEDWLNGGWYAFQERQKIIDEVVSVIHEAYMSDGNLSVESVYDKIQELLK